MLAKILIILSTILCVVSGNLLLKYGVSKPTFNSFWPLSYFNYYILISISFFAAGLLLYTAVLRFLPLNIAQTIFTIQFVSVVIGSHFLFGEQISAIRWFGIGLVVIGLIIVGLTIENNS